MSKELLKNYIDSFIKDDTNTSLSDLSQFIKFKAKEIISSQQIVEFDHDSAIKFNGDEVLVNGKPVGTVVNDLNDLDSDLVFVPLNGGNRLEFANLGALYSYIAKTFNINENSMTQGLDTKIEDPKLLDIDDDLNKLCLEPNDDHKKLPAPDDEAAQVSLTPRIKKIKGLADKIKKLGRVTETKFDSVSTDGNKVEKIKKQINKLRNKADSNGNK